MSGPWKDECLLPQFVSTHDVAQSSNTKCQLLKIAAALQIINWACKMVSGLFNWRNSKC